MTSRNLKAFDGILTAVGKTPLIQLSRVFPGLPFSLFAKLEFLNPSGSIKDRPALGMLKRAWIDGRIGPETVVIESSSGNLGIALAQVCAYLKLQFICVVDAKTSAQNIRILRAYGAKIELVEEPDSNGEFLPARLKRVRTLSQNYHQTFWPNQYINLDNPAAYTQLMDELVVELGGSLDYLFVPISTCGTLRGCIDYVRAHKLQTNVIAVDAVGSLITGEGKSRGVVRHIPGLGAGIQPSHFDPQLIDGYIQVSGLECVMGCRRLLEHEAMLVGGSSGGVLGAVERLKETMAPGASCVMVFPDRGERYLDTVYSDAWVEEHFGTVVNSEAGVLNGQSRAHPR